jgi:hypothetical protein
LLQTRSPLKGLTLFLRLGKAVSINSEQGMTYEGKSNEEAVSQNSKEKPRRRFEGSD